jgi:hypothetical protein
LVRVATALRTNSETRKIAVVVPNEGIEQVAHASFAVWPVPSVLFRPSRFGSKLLAGGSDGVGDVRASLANWTLVEGMDHTRLPTDRGTLACRLVGHPPTSSIVRSGSADIDELVDPEDLQHQVHGPGRRDHDQPPAKGGEPPV